MANDRDKYPLASEEVRDECERKALDWYAFSHAAYALWELHHRYPVAEYIANQIGYTLYAKYAKK